MHQLKAALESSLHRSYLPSMLSRAPTLLDLDEETPLQRGQTNETSHLSYNSLTDGRNRFSRLDTGLETFSPRSTGSHQDSTSSRNSQSENSPHPREALRCPRGAAGVPLTSSFISMNGRLSTRWRFNPMNFSSREPVPSSNSLVRHATYASSEVGKVSSPKSLFAARLARTVSAPSLPPAPNSASSEHHLQVLQAFVYQKLPSLAQTPTGRPGISLGDPFRTWPSSLWTWTVEDWVQLIRSLALAEGIPGNEAIYQELAQNAWIDLQAKHEINGLRQAFGMELLPEI